MEIGGRQTRCTQRQGASSADELNAALEALDLDMLADTVQVAAVKGQGQTKGVSIVVLYSAGLRDHAAYEQWLRRHQASDEPAPRPQYTAISARATRSRARVVVIR